MPRYVVEQMVRSERDDGQEVDDERAADIASSAEGTLVNLNDDKRDDLLVRADSGANITGFWLFRNMGRGWELFLFTVAADLFIRKTRTGGFHDVRIAAASAVTGWEATYKFDGTKYKPGACAEHDLGAGKNGEWGKGRRVKCGGDVKPYR